MEFHLGMALGILPLTVVTVLGGDGLLGAAWPIPLLLVAADAVGWLGWWRIRRLRKVRDETHT